ncbi:unnamed protein product [Didymodactylos carnosus]|uniref:RING-type domain-containing protein n=1 Tax=Didymodactylos carnosus TaxID=1234261 RepID=A0A8S2GKI2_9BILA|nr:unnamed protein product [Didymodactylos carnosus]CAF3526594.1 unnamed protein product [Didymodactylos carnosus]
MASWNEKPNLRPSKEKDIKGKTTFRRNNPNQSNHSYIHALWNETTAPVGDDYFGIRDQNVQYSLNKHKRWHLLKKFRDEITNGSTTSSSSEEEGEEQNNNPNSKNNRWKQKSRYRLYEFHNTEKQANCIGITSNVGEQRNRTPQKTYMQLNTPGQIMNPRHNNNTGEQQQTGNQRQLVRDERRNTGNEAGMEENSGDRDVDVSYYAITPPPARLSNIRKHQGKAKKTNGSIQRARYTQVQEHLDIVEHINDNMDDIPVTPETPYYQSTFPQIMLNSFINNNNENEEKRTTVSYTDNDTLIKDTKGSVIYMPEEHGKHQEHLKELKNIAKNKNDNKSSISAKKFRRQASREERLYNKAMKHYKSQVSANDGDNDDKSNNNEASAITEQKSNHQLMKMCFRSTLLHRSDIQLDKLTKDYGSNFIHAQCYPVKYLIRITDKVKQAASRFRAHWEELLSKSRQNKLDQDFQACFDLFPFYCTLETYLIILFDDNTLATSSDYVHARCAINIDVYSSTLSLENLNDSSPYSMNELIEKCVDFITSLPLDVFKPIENELHRRKYNDDEFNYMSETEFVNHQIGQLQLIDQTTKHTLPSSSTITEEEGEDDTLNEYELIKPSLCTNCYCDMDLTTEATALKTCAHWLCNQCWDQYIQTSIKRNSVITCPEWNCNSVLDVGKR